MGLWREILQDFLDLRDRIVFIGPVCGDVQNGALGSVERQDLKHIVPRCGIPVAFDHDCALEIRACLREQRGGSGMDPEGIFDRILYRFHKEYPFSRYNKDRPPQHSRRGRSRTGNRKNK